MSLARLALAALVALALVAPAAAAPGAIQGRVRYLGKPPARSLDRAADPTCTPAKVPAEDVVVADGGLQDVHVRLVLGKPGKARPPKAKVVVRQVGCAYRPRVVGAIAGQTLVVENGDPTMHNVHAYAAEETAFNRSQPKGAKPIEHALAAPGLFTLKCDVHPWMRAFVAITDHPWFAVTGADGGYAIAGVPPGTYTLEAYHPTLGTKAKPVVVLAGGKAAVDFVFP
jgi:plastocyanin